MTTWQSQPYFAGDLTALQSIFSGASSSLKRIGIWGDSRTDPQVNVNDRLLEQRLNYKAFQRFGPASETPISRVAISTRSTSLDPQFCLPVLIPYGTSYGTFGGAAQNGLSAIDNLPPGFGYHEMDDTGDMQIAFSLDPGNTSVFNNGTTVAYPWSGTAAFFLSSEFATVKPEIFLRKNSSAVATKLQWISAPTDTPAPSLYADINATAVVGGLGFNTGSGVMKWTGPALNHVSGKYDNFAFRGLNDAEDTTKEGMQVCGLRWTNPTLSNGVVFQSFGQGTYDADEVLSNHPDMGQTVATFGPYDAHIVILGANDVDSSYPTPLTNYKVKVRAIIDALKSAPFGGSVTTPIVLMNPYKRSDSDFSAYLDAFAQSLIDLCDEYSNVAFYNVARAFEEAGFDPDDATQSDTIHISNIRTEAHYADMVFGGLEALAGESSGGATAAEVVAAINADATQAAARAAAIAAASQTAAATIRTAVGLESANLASLVNAVVGKQNVTDNGNGTYDLAIRNAADDATLVTIRYNPTTGVKTVV